MNGSTGVTQNITLTLFKVKVMMGTIFLAGRHIFAITVGCVSKLELWNRKVGKSLKIGKNQIKSEKSDLISY